MPLRILLLDPDPDAHFALGGALAPADVIAAAGQAEGLRLLAEGGWDLVLLDENFSGAGLELLSRLTSNGVDPPPVVLLSSTPSMESILAAIRRGAHDVIAKSGLAARIPEIVGGLDTREAAVAIPRGAPADAMVGCSPEMVAVYKSLARASTSDATVLLLGESGTGKEMAARALHAQSRRSGGPFIAINCAAIPENLLESELFGHEKGAFTGAIGRRIGRFERANGGTLFLDEVGDMSLALQAKILRALNEREVERVGGQDSVPLDVRLVAATNQDLAACVAGGRFREDLYYRLAVISLRLPPLRERGPDIDRLVEHFAAVYADRHDRPIRGIAERTLETLRAFSWPGNVRQLRNAVERAVVMCDGPVLFPEHLPPEVRSRDNPPDGNPGSQSDPPLVTLAEMERRMIRKAMAATAGNHTRAAEILGIHRNTLRRKIADYGIGAS